MAKAGRETGWLDDLQSTFSHLFLCFRYPNLDFGWKRSIDGKTFMSSPESCSKDGEDPCKHHAAQSLSSSSPTCPSHHQSPCEPAEPACMMNLSNGTARLDCDGGGHKDEHLHQYENCQISKSSTSVLQSPESIQRATSVCMQPSYSSQEHSSSPQLPSNECATGRTSDHNDKATSVCTWEATAVSVLPAPCLALRIAPKHRSTTGDKSLGPNPGLILQALTLSNASDGFNLERLEMLGDSFLKHAITTYLFCTYPDAHEGRLSYMRSKKVSGLIMQLEGCAVGSSQVFILHPVKFNLTMV